MPLLLRARRALEWRSSRARLALRQRLGLPGSQWARVVMDRETERHVRGLDPRALDALEVSGSKWQEFGFRSYRRTTYPEYDLAAGVPAAGAPAGQQYDLILVEQVLEHVARPDRAVANLSRMLRPGGVAVVTTPFLVRLHLAGQDFQRWSEKGLSELLAANGFATDDVVTGSWGNRACVRANFLGWAPWIPWLDSLENEPEFPVVVWAFARRTA